MDQVENEENIRQLTKVIGYNEGYLGGERRQCRSVRDLIIVIERTSTRRILNKRNTKKNGLFAVDSSGTVLLYDITCWSSG